MIRKTRIFILCMLLAGLLILFLIPIISANNIWINYGQETIGIITLTESLNNPGISLEKTGESMPKSESNTPTNSESGGITIIKEREIIKLVPQREKEDKESKGSSSGTENNNVIRLSNKPSITGAIIGRGLLSGGHLVAIIAIIGGVLVVLIISRTIISIKKLPLGILLIFTFFLFTSISSVYGFSLSRNPTWSSGLEGIGKGSLAFGDIDNDGDLDLILGGYNNSVITKVYINNGTNLVENSTWQQSLTAFTRGSLAFGDIDNDGDLDLALSGCTTDVITSCSGTKISKIYINNGTSLVESLQWQRNLTGAYWSSLAFGDIDNDGDLDLALSGNSDAGKISKIYINNGTSLVESLQWQQGLTGIDEGGIAFGDIDNDGDLDLALSGLKTASPYKISTIYINNGTSLVENSGWWFPVYPLDISSLAFGDIDNDGDLDLIHMGCCDHLFLFTNNGSSLKEYQNDTISGGNQLTGIYDGSLVFGDLNNDGDLDLATMGMEEQRLGVYQWNGTAFVRNNTIGVDFIADNMQRGSLVFIDINNDAKLDLASGGYSYGDGYLTKVYINNITTTNTKPNSPNSSFSATYTNNIITLNWGNGSDAETNTSGLYYNLRVGNSTNNNSIVSGVYGGSSNPTAGYFGNMMQRKSIALNVQLEANKTYYWAVQTIDTGLAKSNWSIMQNFTTSLDVTKPNVTINEPSPNASLHTSNPFFTFNATITDANLTNVTLYADFNGTMLANETNSSGINGTYIFIRNLTSYNDRMYNWYIYACDGNNNCQTSGRSFYLDRTAPIIRAISPANAESWTSSNVVTFSYNVSDVDIANCSLIINNAIVNTSTSVSENTQQNFAYSLSNGNYNWNVNCTDYVGFTNSSSIYILTVSYTPLTSSGGGGGGGGTAITSKTYVVTDEQFTQGFIKELSINDQIKFSIKNEAHYVKIIAVTNTTATINVSSITQQATLFVGEEKKFELTNDSYYDVFIRLNSISNSKANLTVKEIYEEIKIGDEKPEEQKEVGEIAEEEKKEETESKKENENLTSWIVLIVLTFIIFIVVLILLIKKYLKYKTWRKWTLLR